jgi:hypothetical protein
MATTQGFRRVDLRIESQVNQLQPKLLGVSDLRAYRCCLRVSLVF